MDTTEPTVLGGRYRLDDARGKAGVRAWERRPELDRLATLAAEEVAAAGGVRGVYDDGQVGNLAQQRNGSEIERVEGPGVPPEAPVDEDGQPWSARSVLEELLGIRSVRDPVGGDTGLGQPVERQVHPSDLGVLHHIAADVGQLETKPEIGGAVEGRLVPDAHDIGHHHTDNAGYLAAVMGLFQPGLAEQLPVAKRALLAVAGLRRLDLDDAITEILPLFDDEICATCMARVFMECAGRPGGELAEASGTDGELWRWTSLAPEHVGTVVGSGFRVYVDEQPDGDFFTNALDSVYTEDVDCSDRVADSYQVHLVIHIQTKVV